MPLELADRVGISTSA